MERHKKSGTFFAFLKKSLDNHPILFFAGLSILENLFVESLSRHSLLKGLYHMITSPVVFFYNSLIIMLVLSFALLFRRRIFGLVLLSVPWAVCGIANAAVLAFRVTPIGAIDFQIMRLSLMLMYLNNWQRVLLYFTVGIFLLSMIALWIVGPKISGKMNYGKKLASIAGIGVALAVVSVVSHSIFAIGTDFENMAGAYENYGFVYCFSTSVLDTGIDEPIDYDKEQLDGILSLLPKTKGTAGKEKPDVILIQMESFFDARTIKGLSFSQNPVPVHTYLKENFSSGFMEVPSFGGGTANTEFEVLTGINLDRFGPGEYPYKTVLLKETCETMAYNLKENGYSTHAIHNHTGDFYGRDKVYPMMGFDSFQSIEYMNGYETTPYGWCKDKALTKEIMTALTYEDEKNKINTNTPRFVWTVSVQGHGAYPSEPIEGETNVIKIKSDKFDEKDKCAIEYYVQQAWEMDMFLGNLISELEKRKKPTLLIAYGDHLPSLNITDEDLTTGSVYLTEYVTWNNFDLKKTDKNVKTYEISAEIMRWLGFNNGNITKLHQYHSSGKSKLSEEEYQKSITFLAYDMLYGENLQFGGNKPYIERNMRMGTLPVSITGAEVLDGCLYIQGKGFTAKSKIFVNGEKISTQMISEHSLMAEDTELQEGDIITVGQTDSKRDVLSYSDPITYTPKK